MSIGRKNRILKKIGDKVLKMSEDEKILMQLEQEWSLEKAYQQELENREKIGIEKGLKQISTIKKLLERGMSIKDIAEIEEITEEEVIKIQEEL